MQDCFRFAPLTQALCVRQNQQGVSTLSTIIFCLMFIGLMPYMASSISGYYRVKQKGNYDLVNPRKQAAELEGVGERSQFLQSNCWEALILFSVAAFSAVIAEASTKYITALCLAFILFRSIYFWAYLTNRAKLRVGVFTAGLICCLSLFILAINKSFA